MTRVRVLPPSNNLLGERQVKMLWPWSEISRRAVRVTASSAYVGGGCGATLTRGAAGLKEAAFGV